MESWTSRLASRLTTLVIALQGALLLTLWVTPTWTPPQMRLLELLWAWMHRPTFYPLVALIIGGPLLTGVAWCWPGRHRLWLIVGWLGLIILLTQFHRERILAMLRVLWAIWVG